MGPAQLETQLMKHDLPPNYYFLLGFSSELVSMAQSF